MRRAAAIGGTAAALAAAGLLAWGLRPASLERLERGTALRRDRLAGRLDRTHGLRMLLTFDEPGAADFVAGLPVLGPGTGRVPARNGFGRRFDGSPRCAVETPFRWARLGSAYSVSLRIRLDPGAADQDIVYALGSGLRTGFALEGGQLVFDVPFTRRQALAYRFDAYGRFVHLAAVVDAEARTARLYENGRLKASLDIAGVDFPPGNVDFGKREWYAIRRPMRGVVDEAAFWDRALREDEVRRLARARLATAAVLEPADYARWRVSATALAAIRSLQAVPDRLRSGGAAYRGRAAELPHVNFILSGADVRHTRAAHAGSLSSGRRTREAARPRDIRFVLDRQAGLGTLRLYGTDIAYPESPRPSYIFEPADPSAFLGLRRVRLMPPESAGFLMPLVETEAAARMNVPALRNGLCRLSVNGRACGIYYLEDFGTMGLFAGHDQPVQQGPRGSRDWRKLFYDPHPAAAHRLMPPGDWPLSEAALLEAYDGVTERYGPLLTDDPGSPLSRRARRERIEQDRARAPSYWTRAPSDRGPAAQAAAFLGEYAVLGRNASPLYVTGDLSLDVLRRPGLSISWTSREPGVVDAGGRVTRPDGDRPVGVELTARIADGRETIEKSLAFRVMPRHPRVPALMVCVEQPLRKIRRADALLAWHEPGSDTPTRTFWASQATRGGISHRGNTSYWRPKRPLSIRTDAPHLLFGDADAVHVATVNPLTDRSLAHNAVAYDLFRDFSKPGAPRFAPRIRWAEVFVNGAYYGLHELCSRIDETTMPPAGDGPGVVPLLVYKHETLGDAFGDDDPPLRQKRPGWREPRETQAFDELAELVDAAPPARFAAEIGRRVDLGNAIDFQILLNVMQNENGYPFRFAVHDLFARGGAGGPRFYFVPWDFEITLNPPDRWVSNGLLRRLERDGPGYRDAMRTRWRELRAGPLDAAALGARADRIRDLLDGYVEWEYARWGNDGGLAHAEQIERMKREIARQLVRLDEELARRASAAPPPTAPPVPAADVPTPDAADRSRPDPEPGATNGRT
jgi:hypothetical protein